MANPSLVILVDVILQSAAQLDAVVQYALQLSFVFHTFVAPLALYVTVNSL